MQKRLMLASLVLIVVIAALHGAATVFYWYVSIPWFDMMMHALGGVFLAVFCSGLFMRHLAGLDRFELAVTVLLCVLIVGAGWEAFEYVVQYVVKGATRLADVSDSVSDMVCDMAGGIIGTGFVLRLKKRYNAPNEYPHHVP